MPTPETTNKLTLKLDVPMTVEKELEIHREISERLKEIEAIEVQKKRVRPLRDRVNHLNLSIEAQTVEADVECEEFEDIETGLIKTRRLDTNEVFKTRVMDPDERQVKLKIAGKSFDEIQALIGDLNKTEEQVVASTPEEAEEIRNQRLLQEQRDRDAEPPRMPVVGDTVEVIPTGDTEWRKVTVKEATDHSFVAELGGEDLIWDVATYGSGWRWAPTWSDVRTASEQAEVARLAAEQAADAAKDPKPRALLQNPRKKKANGAPKRIRVQDDEGNEIPIPPEEPAAPCPESCDVDHQHSEKRAPF